jgi:hypothetical protein
LGGFRVEGLTPIDLDGVFFFLFWDFHLGWIWGWGFNLK